MYRAESVLELRRGGLPFPHGGPHGEWRYRHAIRPDGPTPLDYQVVADFQSYERTHGRRVRVVADADLQEWSTWSAPIDRPPPGSWPSQCCTHAYPAGCGHALVCHGAPPEAAMRIAETAQLLPATAVTGRAGSWLAETSSWGEPADYFEHVMFANGRCTAPEAVAYSRTLGRALVPTDLHPGYPPAVRFYFRWDELAELPVGRFDGVHPIKTSGALDIVELLVGVIVCDDQAASLLERAHPAIRSRIKVLRAANPAPHEWAGATTAAAERLA